MLRMISVKHNLGTLGRKATKTGKLTYAIFFFEEKFRNENTDDAAGVAVNVIHIRDKLKL